MLVKRFRWLLRELAGSRRPAASVVCYRSPMPEREQRAVSRRAEQRMAKARSRRQARSRRSGGRRLERPPRETRTRDVMREVAAGVWRPTAPPLDPEDRDPLFHEFATLWLAEKEASTSIAAPTTITTISLRITSSRRSTISDCRRSTTRRSGTTGRRGCVRMGGVNERARRGRRRDDRARQRGLEVDRRGA
jgi:hypothetical protein